MSMPEPCPEYPPVHFYGIIYLDMNIFVSMRNEENTVLRPIVEKLRQEGFIFPYSAAHLEEIAMVARNTEDEEQADIRVNANIDYLAQLSQHIAISQGTFGDAPPQLRRECPSECMGRVLKDYHLTHYAEDVAERSRSRLGDATSVLPPVDALSDPKLAERIEAKLKDYKISPPVVAPIEELKENHHQLSVTVACLFDILAEEGFAVEKRKNMRSAIHDVTHATYGVMSDIFVTNDEKFRAKVKAVYHAIGSETEVISGDEFITRFQ